LRDSKKLRVDDLFKGDLVQWFLSPIDPIER